MPRADQAIVVAISLLCRNHRQLVVDLTFTVDGGIEAGCRPVGIGVEGEERGPQQRRPPHRHEHRNQC